MPDTNEATATEYGTVEIYGAHGLTEADVVALYPEGAIREAALSAVRAAAGSRFAPLGPCSDCPECIEKGPAGRRSPRRGRRARSKPSPP